MNALYIVYVIVILGNAVCWVIALKWIFTIKQTVTISQGQADILEKFTRVGGDLFNPDTIKRIVEARIQEAKAQTDGELKTLRGQNDNFKTLIENGEVIPKEQLIKLQEEMSMVADKLSKAYLKEGDYENDYVQTILNVARLIARSGNTALIHEFIILLNEQSTVRAVSTATRKDSLRFISTMEDVTL